MKNKEENISIDRKNYLRKIFIKKSIVLLTQIIIVIAIIATWEILANNNIIDSFITSQPSRIVDTLLNLSSNGLLEHIGVTCIETIIGFISGTLLGIIVAICLWWSKFLSKVAEPFLVVLNSLPKVALRTNNNYLGWSRNAGNYSYGSINFINSNYT